MPLPHNFAFAGRDAVQRATETIARTLFGEEWRVDCDSGQAPSGLPAIFKGDVMLAYSRWAATIFCGGLANDAAGLPASHAFDATGGLESTWHEMDGLANDPADGRPANIEYHMNGNPKLVRHMKGGKGCDSSYGHPAEIYYTPDGAISHGKSTVLCKDLTAEECMVMEKQARMRRISAWTDANVSQDVVAVGMHAPAAASPVDCRGGRCI